MKFKNKHIACYLLTTVYFLLSTTYIFSQIWSKVPGAVKPIGVGIEELIVYKNKLIVHGNIDSVDNIRSTQAISWNGVKWDSLGIGLWGGLAGAMAVYNNEMYIGGGIFVNDGTWPKLYDNVLRWDGLKWDGANVLCGTSCARIYAMEVYNGELYVAGQFNQIGGKSVNNIARWNGSVWKDVGGG